MARISLIPQKREFFVLYSRAADNAIAIARKVVELLDRFPEDCDRIAREVKELEHEGDRLTHEIVDLVNRTHRTPFGRDDMVRLAGALDDVCDHVDEAAGKIVDYGVREIRESAKEQARIVERSAAKLAEAIAKLDGFADSRRQLVELRALEDRGDDIARRAISELFTSIGGDPLAIMRWKDIHEQLEEAADACENAADVLETILVKHR